MSAEDDLSIAPKSPEVVDTKGAPITFVDWFITGGMFENVVNVSLGTIDHSLRRSDVLIYRDVRGIFRDDGLNYRDGLSIRDGSRGDAYTERSAHGGIPATVLWGVFCIFHGFAIGLCGRLWAAWDPRWESQLAARPGGLRSRRSERTNETSACAYPVLTQQRSHHR